MLYKVNVGPAGGPGRKREIRLATSEDGIDWEIYSENPVLKSRGMGWDRGGASHPRVEELNGLLVMGYTGFSNTDAHPRHGGLAFSLDGKNWVKHPENPVLHWKGSRYLEIFYGPYVFRDRMNLFYSTGSPDGGAEIWLSQVPLRGVSEYFRNDARGEWDSVSIDAGESTYGIPTLGYDNVTIKFVSDTAGTLTIETWEPGDGGWQTLATKSPGTTLKEYILDGRQRGVRLSFDAAATVTAWYELGGA